MKWMIELLDNHGWLTDETWKLISQSGFKTSGGSLNIHQAITGESLLTNGCVHIATVEQSSSLALDTRKLSSSAGERE